MPESIHFPVRLNRGGMRLVLSNQHSASRYGVPVLESERRCYGPSDYLNLGPLPQHGARTAASVIYEWASTPGRTEPQLAAARMFLRQWPDGPQISA